MLFGRISLLATVFPLARVESIEFQRRFHKALRLLKIFLSGNR